MATAVSAFDQNRTELQSEPNHKYILYVDSAERYIQHAQWTRAEEMIRKALRLSPANPVNTMLFSNLGVCLSAQEKYEDALEAFEIALIRNPRSAITLSSRGRTYIALKRDKEALDDFNAALALDSTLQQTRQLRAHILMINGNIDEAKQDFLSLTRQYPLDYNGPYGLGQCAEIEGNITEALQYYKDAATIEQNTEHQPDIIVAIARTMIDSNMLNEADDVVREGIRQFPRHGMLYLMRAWLHRLRFQNEDEKIDKKLAREYGVEPQIIDLYIPD
ncbi:MAG: tetratricopeptide repeat protein [Muribaculaceae bacterium]|nr:tetratricopeptide repeat protein [Muribaculaceae bacterium]